VKVLFLPDYSAANAYQRSLAAGLAALAVEVSADPTGSRRVLPVFEAVRRHGRPDLIHLHWTEPYIAGGSTKVSALKARRTLLELRLARRAGSGLVWTAHDLFRHDRGRDAAELAFMRSLFGLADAVIVHCASAADELAGTLAVSDTARERIAVIPHGHYRGAYADEIGRAAARERLGLPPAARVIAFVGWIRPYKGVTELIEAFGRLDEPDARLVVAGQAVDEAYAAQVMAAAARDGRVTLSLGFVPDEDLQLYLRAADAVALPFLEIFTSGSVLLAMSFERAVIAPRRGCVGEVLDEAGAILYDAGDPGGLEAALRAAMSADLEVMGGHNAAGLARFDWSRVAEATKAVYDRVVGRRGGSSAQASAADEEDRGR
jgi:glycosyltransferase involved in cell wall biosynthesis